MDLILQPFLLSLVAGAATGIGGILVLLSRKAINDRVVGFSMGLASGVMLLVSFNSLFIEATKILANLELIAMFSVGALIMMVLDLTLPHIELTAKDAGGNSRMFRTGLLIASGITLHNFPEGLVVATGYMHMPRLGLAIAIAIMLHNIPEGVATAIPLSLTGMKRTKIATLTFLSGLSEPVAALLASFFLVGVGTKLIGSSLALAAGVMTYITADELIPVAHEYGHKHVVSVGLLLGIIFALLVDVVLS